MTILDLLDNFVSITPEVTSSGRAVFLPSLEANPAKVVLALQHAHITNVRAITSNRAS